MEKMRPGRRRLPWVTRGAVSRLGILGLVLLVVLAWGYSTMIGMPGKSFQGPLPPLTEEETGMRDRLRAGVEALAGRIGKRNVFEPGSLAAAATWIESTLRELGYTVASEEYAVDATACRILSVEEAGREPGAEIVLLGAHYDSVAGCPGANDNASGVAALLEIARWLRGKSFARTVRLVAFPNEEPPHFQTERMGSLVYAKGCRERGERIAAMVSLETLGCYRDEPGSQAYPPPFSLFYPDRGNFIGFVGDRGSRALVRRCVGIFREEVRFPCEGGALPAFVPGVGWSDHWSFWQYGYPAVMVTDTAPFRYPHYHTAEDTPEKLDHDRLARVVAGLTRVVARLAGGD